MQMAKYQCTVCGYIYDPELGDPDGNIEPGTPFEELPDDWTCPLCGASKGEFEKLEEESLHDRKPEQRTTGGDIGNNTDRDFLRR